MLGRWYLLLGQFSVTFEYRPGAQHSNVDGMSRQCGHCQRPDCPVSAMDSPVPDAELETEMMDQPFAASEMGETMDADLLPELSGETWVASALIEEFTVDLLPNPLRHGRSVLGYLRSYAVGSCKWAICPSTQMASNGGAGRRRRHARNWWYPGVNGEQ